MGPEYVPEYLLWQEAIALRDQGLSMLFLVALALVASWAMTDFWPSKIAQILRMLFFWGGLVLWVVSLFSYWIV
jgi:hypothetical protein